MVMLPRLRQAADSFWHLLGGSSDIADAPHLSASKVAHLEACLAAALGPDVPAPPETNGPLTNDQLRSWLDSVARTCSPQADDEEAAAHFLVQLFRHCTTTKGPLASINKRVERDRIPDSVVLQGRKHRLLAPDAIGPLLGGAGRREDAVAIEAAAAVGAAVNRAVEATVGGMATPPRMLRFPKVRKAQVDEALEAQREERLRERAAALEGRREEARMREEGRQRLAQHREASIAAKQQRIQEWSVDSDEDE